MTIFSMTKHAHAEHAHHRHHHAVGRVRSLHANGSFPSSIPHGGGFRFNVRIVAPTIPLVNTKCALLYDFPLFWRFLRDFLFIAPVFRAHGQDE